LLPLDQVRDRDLQPYPCSLAGLALHLKLSPHLQRPLLYRVPADAYLRVLGGEPAAGIGYLGEGEIPFDPQLNPDVLGPGVAADVREGLLDGSRKLLARPPRHPGREPSSTNSTS
jgi:hypothetical protein